MLGIDRLAILGRTWIRHGDPLWIDLVDLYEISLTRLRDGDDVIRAPAGPPHHGEAVSN